MRKKELEAIITKAIVKSKHTKLSESIDYKLTWADTEEGFDFWSDICNRLKRIERNGR